MIGEILGGLGMAVLFFLILLMFDKFKFRRLQKNYDKEDDKTRRTGKQFGGRLGKSSGPSTIPNYSFGKDSVADREEPSTVRKNRKGIRRILRR